MSVAAKSKLDLATGGPLPRGLSAPPPVVFSRARPARPGRPQRALRDPLRSAVIVAIVVALVAATFLLLGYLFGEAILGG